MSTLFTSILLSFLAPSDGGYTRDQLKLLASTASQEFSQMESRCSTLTQPPDLAAEASFRRSADLMEIVVQHWAYPAGRSDQNLRSNDVGSVAQSLERAYLCNPGWEQRNYLERAIRMLEQRITQIRDEEKRPQSEPDSMILQQVRDRLMALTGALTKPPSSTPPPCKDVSRKCDADQPTAPSPGPYRAKYMDLFSLRVELGFGLGTHFTDATSTSYDNVFLFGVAPGVRFLLGGEHKRHVLATGFRWNVLAFKHASDNNRVHQMVARFEYGLRLHERWFSLHAAFEPGIQARVQATSFGTAQLGGSGAVCTGNEAFCVRFGGYSGTFGGAMGLAGMFIGAGIDVFRVTDNILQRAGQ